MMSYIRWLTNGLAHQWRWLPFLVTLLAITVHFAPIFAGDRLLTGMDGLLIFYPAEQALAESLDQGTLPFWTPYIQAGFPLLADGQPGALYPPNLLAFGALPAPLAHNGLILFHTYLGTLFVFLWGGVLRRSSIAAALMGLIYALSTPLAGLNMPMLETLAWSPLVFVLTEKLVRSRRPKWAWLLSPVVALQWLAGFPQIAFYTMIAAAIYFASRLWVERNNWRQAGLLALIWLGAVGLGLGLAAVQILPTYELAQHSIRSGGISGSMAGERSLFPAALVTYLLPAWLKFFAGAGLGFGAYIGILPLALVLFALLDPADRGWKIPLAIVCVATAVLALGRFSPLFVVLREAPGFSSFRVPSRFLFLTQLALVALVGFGWDEAFSPKRKPEHHLARILGLAVLLMVAATALVYPLLAWLRPQLLALAQGYTMRFIVTDAYHVQPWSYYEAKIGNLYAALMATTSWTNSRVAIPLAVTISAWLTVRLNSRIASGTVAGVWAALIVIDLIAFSGVISSVPVAWVEEPPNIAQFLTSGQKDPACRYYLWIDDEIAVAPAQSIREVLPTNYNMLFRLTSTGIYSPLAFAAYYELMQELGTVNLAFGMRPTSAPQIARFRPVLDLLNVCRVLSRQPSALFEPIVDIDGVSVYANPAAFPRAFIVDQLDRVHSVDEALARTKSGEVDLRTTAIVETILPISLTPGAAAGSSVEFVRYAPTHVELRASAEGNVLLILSDTLYPGWRASVDGDTVQILRAYGLFRAVALGPGDHIVQFDYSSVSFHEGLAVTSIACLLWLLLSFVARTRVILLL